MAPVDRKNRRSHAKSRRGCLSCKQRHVKCDETRPACINCLTSHRRCPFLDATEAGASQATTPVQSIGTLTSLTLTSSSVSTAPPYMLLKVENQGQALLEVELLQHWLNSTSQTCLGKNSRSTFFAAMAVNTGLRYPLVMHALLAFSALHLSWKDEARREVLLQEMTHFEERGMIAFKELDLAADSRLVIPCLLFSFITGVHRLCYALAHCSTDPENFISSVAECMSLLRGVSIVIAGHMELVRQSELGPLLMPVGSDPPRTNHRSDLKVIETLKKICDSTVSSEYDSDILMEAIDALHTLYEDPDDESDYGIGSIIVWMMKAPSGLLEMLNRRSPPALIVLAHTAPSLQRRRRCWAVGGSAALLIHSVAEAIPAEWHHWLDWPRRAIG